MLEVMKQDYIILARSKGTSYKKVVIKHALKNAMIPVITYAGPAFAYMLTGSFVIKCHCPQLSCNWETLCNRI